MWPFKPAAPRVPFVEFIQTQPEPPCGDKEVHYQWTIGSNLKCPACAGLAHRKQKRVEEDRMADLIAAKVVEKMLEAYGKAKPAEKEQP